VAGQVTKGMVQMSGITVGIDGSRNGHTALDWAMREAALRKTTLNVLTVHEVMASYWTGNPVTVPSDAQAVEHARQAAQEAVAAAAKQLDTDEPPVTVTAINGFAAQALIDASADSDLVVVGNRGGGGFAHLSLGAVSSKVVHHAHCPVVVVPSAE
jgi:nucleotide-binding universal stress UspA family protein